MRGYERERAREGDLFCMMVSAYYTQERDKGGGRGSGGGRMKKRGNQ